MKIVVIVEGATETAFKGKLSEFIATRLGGKTPPKLNFVGQGGRIPTGKNLQKVVENLLSGKQAADAKAKMRNWVGPNLKFHAHAAQHDFEAWLLPFWDTIQQLAGHNKAKPSGSPEDVNHDKPPAYRIKEIFEVGKCRDSYKKPRDGKRILKDNKLIVAAQACPELKAFLNTILSLCGGELIA